MNIFIFGFREVEVRMSSMFKRSIYPGITFLYLANGNKLNYVKLIYHKDFHSAFRDFHKVKENACKMRLRSTAYAASDVITIPWAETIAKVDLPNRSRIFSISIPQQCQPASQWRRLHVSYTSEMQILSYLYFQIIHYLML